MTPEERVNEVIADYLMRAAREGRAPDRNEVLARHPDLADELAAFFADQDRLARPLRGLISGADPGPAPEAPPAGPRVVGDYELLGELGRGGMGVVYRARQVSLNRVVALKMIRAGRLASEAEVQRFRLEAEYAALLDHPNVVPVYEVGEHEGLPYFSMKLIEGTSLDACLDRFRDRPADAVRLLLAVAGAVAHAHRHGVLHRDLKPANVLLDAEGRPRVTDFGLAKRLAGADLAVLTRSGAIVGTPGFMAPEQAGGAAVTTAADVYGLGGVLYALLTGEAPAAGASPFETLARVLEGEPRPPRSLNPRVDRDLETVVLTCLHRDPGRRYPSADALAEDLRRHRDGRPILARRTPWWERAWKWARRRPTGAALVVTAVLAVAAAAAAVGLYVRVLGQQRDFAVRQEGEARAHEQAANELREKYRAQFRLALEAAREMLTRVARDDLRNVPQAEVVRRDLLDRAVRLYKTLQAEVPGDAALQLELAQAWNAAGNLARLLGEPAAARDDHREAIALLTPLAAAHDDEPAYAYELAAGYQDLARAFHDDKETDAAEADYREALGRFDALVGRQPGVARPLRARAHTKGNLAALYQATGRADLARRLYEEGVADLERLAAGELGQPEPADSQRLAKALDNLGILHTEAGRRAAAAAAFRRSLGLREELVRTHPEDFAFRQDLARGCNNLGLWDLNFDRSPAGLDEADHLLARAVRLNRALAYDRPRVPDHQQDLVQSLVNLGTLHDFRRRPDAADGEFRQAVAAADELARAFPRVAGHREAFVKLLRQLGPWYRAQGRSAALADAVRPLLPGWQRLAEAFPEDPGPRAVLEELRTLTGTGP
jgi:serine/threonine-protein kinase